MRSSSDRALGPNFLREFSEVDSSIPVSVHFVNDLLKFLLAYEVASGFDHSSKFDSADASVAVQVKTIEGLVCVESWLGGKSLSQALSSVLTPDVCPPHALEFEGSVWKENIISSHNSWNEVGWSSGNHLSVVSILGEEHLLELSDG